MTAVSPAKVVAVVLNWRDAESTRSCVASLLASQTLANVVVVDNESTGQLRELGGDRLELIEVPENRGFSGGVNVGLRRALQLGADGALVINNDAVVEPGSVEKLIDVLERRGDAGLIAPRVCNPDFSPQSTGGSFRQWDASSNDLASSDVDYLTWACVLLPRATMEKVGLLDEAFFMYWEDVDFGLRVRDAGLDLIVVDDARVIHQRSRSHGSAGVAIDRYSARGLVVLARKRGGILLWVGMPMRIAARVGRRLLSGSPAAARAVLSGVSEGRRALIRKDFS